MRNRRILLFVSVLLSLACLALRYPDREQLGREIERLEEYLRKAQAADGPECAPESLAAAQAHLARAKDEFQEGDLWDAEDAIRLCQKEAEGIFEKILGCNRGLDRDRVPARIPRMAMLTEDKIEILVPILFDDETQQPLRDSDEVLEDVAGIMEDNPDLRVRVQSHVDNGLPPEQADAVTEQRAENVRSALVRLGIAEDRLEAEGRGSREPVAANDSAWGRMLNQRVEFIRIR